MYHPLIAQATLAISFLAATSLPRNLVLSNDDGWATAQIRAQFDALIAAGYGVILSAPALNQSGKGSRTKTPTVLNKPCEFETCPLGSPAEGFNASDPRLNYVNGYPVDAARYGVQTLSRRLFDKSSPDFVVSGPNIGLNIGVSTQFSGTVGAAAEASKLGIPAIAFSGASGSQRCPDPSAYRWVLARNLWNPFAEDVETCGSTRLPSEADVVEREEGCFASVSVISAVTKTDVDRATQAALMATLYGLHLSCLD
ncbi:sure-like protein [Daedalea quercina L-15889]|uniref:Sure-like protein n=1 Tax=Daedalea quercina L-15889 TaxID=1314783 RepID=A0A165QGL9_9APHY|nr:sure-like protein [Daedalea quercina L-15889]